MKKVILVCLLNAGFLLGGFSYAKAAEQQLDQVIAVVNDDIITKSELNQALALIKMQMAQAQAPLPASSVLEKQTIEQLINKKLQLQIAKQAGIQVSDAELDTTIENIAKQNQMTLSEFYERLGREGMSVADYKNEMHDQILLHRLQQQEVISRISVSPDEVDRFMRSNVWQNNSTKEYHIEDILIPSSDAPSPEEIEMLKKRAEAIMTKLNQGQDFHKLAQAEPADRPLKSDDLGWRKIPEIPSIFAEQIVRLQPKELAGPIQAPNGFHIIRLIAERATANAQQAAPDRKQIEELLLQRKFEEGLQNWVSRMRSQAFIVVNGKKQQFAF